MCPASKAFTGQTMGQLSKGYGMADPENEAAK